MFSAYMLDPEHGWIATHRLPMDAAVRACKEYRRTTAGGLVAIVPDKADPQPYLELAKMASCGLAQYFVAISKRPHLRVVA